MNAHTTTRRTLTTLLLTLLTGLLATPAAAQTQGDVLAEAWVQGGDDAYADVQAPVRDLRVELWHENESEDAPYRRGESFDLYFETNGDSYVVVYRIDVDGDVEILWPSTRYDDGFVYGNHVYTVPRQGSPVRLTAGRSKGVEYVQAIASELPFDLRRLSIDFRFDMNDPTNHDYRIAGDPFLAVNDINFAITGLEEDVDYVVTDWAHLYVESKVDYARYTCTQCHADDDAAVYSATVRPYVDECTTINVYADYGWQRRWYGSFGWYPLYYEPAYYYWDPYYGRPYWYSYYPVYYSWPSYPVYVRPYSWYAWRDTSWYGGDFRVRYNKHGGNRLYDFDRVKTRNVGSLGATATRVPTGVDRFRSDGRSQSPSRERLVRDRPPTQVRNQLTPRTTTTLRDQRTRAGIRTDRTNVVRRDKRLTSLTPRTESTSRSVDRTRTGRSQVERQRSGSDSRSRTERRWTRPVIRNDDANSSRDRGSVNRDRSDVRRDRSTGPTRSTPNVDRSRSTRPRVERSTPTRRDTNVQRERSSSSTRREVERPRTPTRSVDRDRSTKPKRQVERSKPSTPRRQKASPPRSSTPKRESSGSSRSSGGSKSRTRKGGGGRG